MGDYILDIVLILPLAWGAFRGFMKGVVYEAAIVMVLVFGFWGASKFAFYGEELLRTKFGFDNMLVPYLSFFLVFLAVAIVIMLLAKFLEGMIKITGLNIINKVLGAVFGLIKWILIVALLVFMFQPLDASFSILPKEKIDKSIAYKWVGKAGEFVFPELSKFRNFSFSDKEK